MRPFYIFICAAILIASRSFAQSPMLTITNNSGTNTLSCFTPDISLTAVINPSSFPITYTWVSANTSYNGSTVLINAAGTYTITGFNTTNSFSLTQILNISISGNTFVPTVSIISSNPALSCAIPSITLLSNAFTSIPSNSGYTNNLPVTCSVWNGPFPQITASNTCNYIANVPGVYTLTVTDQNNGCKNSATKIILDNTIYPLLNSPPAFNINCPTPTVVIFPNLIGSVSSNSYTWTAPAGASLGSINSLSTIVNAPGIYTLQASNLMSSCISSVQISVAVCAPTFSITNTTGSSSITCANPSVNLLGSVANYSLGPLSYIWVSNSSTLSGASVTITNPGTYLVTSFNTSNSFSLTQLYTINIDTLSPVISAPPSSLIPCLSNTLAIYPIYSFSNTNLSFNWLVPSSASVSAFNTATIITNSPGVYTVTAIDTINGCQSSGLINVTSCVGLKEQSIGSVIVSPNPAKDWLFFSLGNKNSFDVIIFGMDGALIKQQSLSADNPAINITSIPEGVYFVKITSNNKSPQTIKLIKVN